MDPVPSQWSNEDFPFAILHIISTVFQILARAIRCHYSQCDVTRSGCTTKGRISTTRWTSGSVAGSIS